MNDQNGTQTDRLSVDQSIMPKICNWLKTRNGVAVWQNRDLSSAQVGQYVFTPAFSEDLKTETVSPHWKYGNKPERVLKSLGEIAVPKIETLETVKISYNFSNGKLSKKSENLLDKRVKLWREKHPEYTNIFRYEKPNAFDQFGEAMDIYAETGAENAENLFSL